MKKPLLFVLLSFFLMTACRQTSEGDRSVSTFSSRSTSAATASDKVKKPVKDSVVIDLLKQKVGRGVSEIKLVRRSYVCSYNKQTRTPNWVAWTLTRDHTYGNIQRDNERFEEDTSVPEPRATFQDFYNSRYDRGHMCPAGDNKWDAEAMKQTFLMTNICPQNHGLNKEYWNELEIQCRTWARRFGEITVVCGPLFEDGEPRLIGRNKVRVPTGFFKVVYCHMPEPKAIAFIFRNNGTPQPWREKVVSVDEVEHRTGFDFLYMLPDVVENKIEAVDDLKGW